ncbi:hypothetical protein AAHC03_04866 [Spirometra sp. Aus1]
MVDETDPGWSSKPGWLIERGVLSKEYVGSLELLADKVAAAEQATAEKIRHISKEPVLYLFCQKALEYLEKTDDTKDFFGRSSSDIRQWRDLVSRYEKQKLYLGKLSKSFITRSAEVAERLNELCFLIPKCKSAIADRQKLITDLQKKVKEFSVNQQSKEAELDRFRKRFEITDDYVRLQLLEKANTVPQLLSALLSDLHSVAPAVEYYTSFTEFIHKSNSDAQKTPALPCSTLRLLLSSGHVTVYEWKNGRAPDSIGKSDDYLADMLSQERKRVEKLKTEIETTAQSAELELSGVNLLEFVGESTDVTADNTDLNDIDFGDLAESFGLDVVDVTESAEADAETGSVAAAQNTSRVARGANARLLLDTSEGRASLIGDLEELTTFLQRMIENQRDFHASTEGSSDTQKPSGGIDVHSLAPIYHQILQDVPRSVSAVSSAELSNMAKDVKTMIDKITDETLSHLLLLRLQPGYLDRLIDSMHDLKRQADRAKTKMVEATAAVRHAENEIKDLHTELIEEQRECKEHIRFLESHLSKMYDREIRLIGSAIAV